MMKKFFSLLIALLMLFSCVGCANSTVTEELPQEVAETAPEEESEKESELLVGKLNADGLLPNGLVGIYLEGEDASDRLADFSKGNLKNHSERYTYQGIGQTDTGAVMNIIFTNTGADLAACLSELADLAKREGFNQGECRIEYDLCKPPFIYSEDVMRNMYKNSVEGDPICITDNATMGRTVELRSDEFAEEILEKHAKEYGYAIKESVLTAEDYKTSHMNLEKVAFAAGYATDKALTSLEKVAPTFLRYPSANVRCKDVEDYQARASWSLMHIFGVNILEKVCQTGLAAAESRLDLGTDHILQSNWGYVYTDADGNFRTRLSLMVKDPAEKSGWHVTAYEVLVHPVEGDKFTCTDYEAGEIIQLLPYIDFETSLKCGEGKVVKENGEQMIYEDGECGLTVIDICHAFIISGKSDVLWDEHPEWMEEHNNCQSIYC